MITMTGIVAGYGGVEFTAHGDDVATVLTINLAKTPFNLVFTGPLPVPRPDEGAAPVQATLVANATGDPILTITYAASPTSVYFSAVNTSITFVYPSL